MGFELSAEYKDVAARLADLKEKYPDASLQPVNPAEPYRIEAIDGKFFIVYTAAAYRNPDDPKPGIGVAWEPFPGRTPYTKDSELQNAETSAWGRAIIAALASESKHIASAEDVRNRWADAEVQPVERFVAPTGEVIDIWPGELSMKAAKGELLMVLGGDKDAATKAWTASGFDGRWKLRREELDPLLLLMRGGSKDTKEGAGVDGPDRGGDASETRASGSQSGAGDGADSHDVGRTGSEPAPHATGEGAPAAQHAGAPEPTETSFGDNPIDARAIGIRAPKVFDKVIESYPDRKKTWVQDQLRHAMAFLVSGGVATSTSELAPDGLLKVWRMLDDIEAGTVTFTFSAQPTGGCEFLWDDGTTQKVLWSDLTLAEAGVS